MVVGDGAKEGRMQKAEGKRQKAKISKK